MVGTDAGSSSCGLGSASVVAGRKKRFAERLIMIRQAVGSVASLSANVTVAEPTATGWVIAAWPSFALIAAYELLMR